MILLRDFTVDKNAKKMYVIYKIHNIILNFPTVDFPIKKIKEREIQNSICHSLPYFSICYPRPALQNEEKN